eukprot:CAMPEP_0201486178 /NCGR_PEP_ID=MMETSP0151_2-20130828/10219_1 /ASSEMBLY_ACC=CAM_ASM_000257 /TAXON_ID=200890 /ORGANISM="Paramoeba atlantica, Strain 621/1 / CCAP 1560/9" /LENGTH=309 /DNA_ID=CAMNT_0047870661 /DNA_START=105 /DNA_END=1034 /DNA_ORIENTATION=-
MPVVDLLNPVSYQLLAANDESQEEQEIMEGVAWLLGLRHCQDKNYVLPTRTPFKTTAAKLSQTSKALRGSHTTSGISGNENLINPSSVGGGKAAACPPTTASPLRGETVNLGVQDINKKRKRATREEVAVLRRAFAVNPLPPLEVRSRIAQQLNWTPRKVKIWFQNERAKIRKRSRDLDSSSSPERVRTPDSSVEESSSSQDERESSPKMMLPSLLASSSSSTSSSSSAPSLSSLSSSIPSYGISHLREATPSPVPTPTVVAPSSSAAPVVESPLSTSRIHHGIPLFTPTHQMMNSSFISRKSPAEVQV